MNQPPSDAAPVTDGGSLLHAAEVLWAAAQSEIRVDLSGNLAELLLHDSVRMLAWQAVALLPADTELVGDVASPTDLVTALEEVEHTLRACPIWEYPPGTTHLVAGICETIARARSEAGSS